MMAFTLPLFVARPPMSAQKAAKGDCHESYLFAVGAARRLSTATAAPACSSVDAPALALLPVRVAAVMTAGASAGGVRL